MHKDEFEILSAVSAKLDEDTVLVFTYQYHTEKDPADPAGQRNDKSKARYRFLGRVMKGEELEALAKELHRDENRTASWRWPGDPSWGGSILYAKDATNEGFSRWLRNKAKKAVPWPEAARILAGWKKDPEAAGRRARHARNAKRPPAEEVYCVHNPNTAFALYGASEGLTCSDGTVVDLKDPAELAKKAGQNVWKEIKMKAANPA